MLRRTENGRPHNRKLTALLFTDQTNHFCLRPSAAVNSSQMITEAAPMSKLPVANLALVTWAIRAMNSSQMFTQVGILCKVPTANLALVSAAILAVNSSQM